MKSLNEMMRKMPELMGRMREFDMKSSKGNLKDFSPWLASFQADVYKCHLEIPGE